MKALVAITLRAALGVFWLWAGFSKLLYGFNATAFILAIPLHVTASPTEVTSLFVEGSRFIAPYSGAVNAVIPILEVAAGIAFISGYAVAAAVVATCAMSSIFIVCGAVSTNPWLLFASAALALTYEAPGDYRSRSSRAIGTLSPIATRIISIQVSTIRGC